MQKLSNLPEPTLSPAWLQMLKNLFSLLYLHVILHHYTSLQEAKKYNDARWHEKKKNEKSSQTLRDPRMMQNNRYKR